MSYARNRHKKDRKALRSQEEKAVGNKIRAGVFPRHFFTKQKIGANQLQRDSKGHLTWKIESTYKALTGSGDKK